MAEYEGEVSREVGEAVEDEADFGEGDVDEADVEASIEADVGDEGLLQSDWYFGNLVQYVYVVARVDWCGWNGGCSQNKHWGKQNDKAIVMVMKIWHDGCKVADVQGKQKDKWSASSWVW